MLTLNDGRSEIWQWDTGRTLDVDADCSQVHFSNKVFGRSIDVDVVDGAAIIPDVLLQTDKDLNVWAFVGTAENGYTKISKTFKVNRRNKPADYVFTPTEQTTIDEIAAIAQSVRDDADAGLFNGEPGDNGITPHIGDNGNWYLGAEDTGKPSQGDTGATGPAGPQGPAGAPGKDGAGMDITGATVGQIAKIAAVDASGVPTAWRPADMPSGGSSDFVITGSLTESGGITLDKTFAQIQEAVQAGKNVLMRVDGGPTTITLPLAVKNSDISTEYDFSIGYFIDGRLNGVTVMVMESGPVLYTASTPTNNLDGTMPQVNMAASPTEAMQIATKQYVDTHATGGTDMGITGAAVGQIAKITDVDESGVPTAWEPVDLPGGGGDEWVKVAETTLTEIANEIRLNFAPCKAVYIEFQYGAVEGNLGVIGIYPNPQTPIYTAEKRTCAVDTTTSDKNKRGYIFCTIDRRKGTQWVATSQIFNRGDGAFGSIQPGSLMNCDIWVSNDNTWASLLPKERLVGTDYINSVSAFGAGMNIGTTLTVWGIKA